MNTQLSLFEHEATIPVASHTSTKVIQLFPNIPPRKPNYRAGGEQTVFPIKRQEDLNAMASWLYHNADRKYLLGFILGINLGLRANELLELKHSDIFFPNGELKYVSDDFSDTTDKMSVYQNKVHIKNIKLSRHTAYRLLLAIEEPANKDIGRTLFYALFSLPNQDFIDLIEQSRTPISTLVEDENAAGSIEIYDFRFRKDMVVPSKLAGYIC